MNARPRIAFLIALLLPALALAQEQQINIIFTADSASCSAWLNYAGNKLVRAHYEFWVRGFVSGHNFANPAHQVKLDAFPASDALYRYLDEYCRSNPQRTFVDGTIRLLTTLRESPDSKKTPTAPVRAKQEPAKAGPAPAGK